MSDNNQTYHSQTTDALQESTTEQIVESSISTTVSSRALSNYKFILSHCTKNTLYSEECRKYLFDRFLEDSCIALMKREHHHFNSDYNMADTINECCKLLINIAVPLIKDDSQLAMQFVYYCMNSSNPFFRHFGHDWVCKINILTIILLCKFA